MTEEKKHDRVNMNWPVGLKEQVTELTGARGLTEFVVGAVEQRLSGEDRAVALEKEIGDLRHLTQLTLDRYVMGGDHEDREAFLMELDLPAWLRTDGWPSNLAKLKPVLDPISEPVLAEERRTPTQPPAPITGEPKQEYTEADLHAPSYVVAGTPKAGKSPMPASPEVLEVVGEHMITPGGSPAGTYTAEAIQTPVETPAPQGRENPAYTAPSDSFLARVQAKAAEKGIDVSGAGLVPASKIDTPAKPAVHNHAWVRHDDGVLHCDCGASIEEPSTEHPTGIVREPAAELPTEPAPVLEVPTPAPTPVAPPARDLDAFDVDF